jgi:hypothetical protein
MISICTKHIQLIPFRSICTNRLRNRGYPTERAKTQVRPEPFRLLYIPRLLQWDRPVPTMGFCYLKIRRHGPRQIGFGGFPESERGDHQGTPGDATES